MAALRIDLKKCKHNRLGLTKKTAKEDKVFFDCTTHVLIIIKIKKIIKP